MPFAFQQRSLGVVQLESIQVAVGGTDLPIHDVQRALLDIERGFSDRLA